MVLSIAELGQYSHPFFRRAGIEFAVSKVERAFVPVWAQCANALHLTIEKRFIAHELGAIDL
jgi:hypothetical protein